MNERANTKNQPTTIPQPAVIQQPVLPNVSALPGPGPLGGASWNVGLEPWPEPVDGEVLLNELAGVFARFVVLPPWAAEVLALWTLHTYAFHLREVTAYLGIEFPNKRCGKSKLLKVVHALVNRPLALSEINGSGLLRVIEETRPTLLIDEVGGLVDYQHELSNILNSGHKRSSAFVAKVTNPPSQKTEFHSAGTEPQAAPFADTLAPVYSPGLMLFSSWCPKLIAVTGRLAEPMTNACVPICMPRKKSPRRCDRYGNLEPYAIPLMRRSARFVFDHSATIAKACPEIPSELEHGPADTWEPLLALADVVAPPWPTLARQAAVALASDSKGK